MITKHFLELDFGFRLYSMVSFSCNQMHPFVSVEELCDFDFVVCFFGSAVLAHFFLKEKLQKMGILGCVLCIVGSTLIVLHAPSESSLTSVEEIWELATQPGKYFEY